MNSAQRALAKLDTEPVFSVHRTARQLRKALREDAAVMECIEKEPRMYEVEIARAAGIPLSTLHTRLQNLLKHFRLIAEWQHRENKQKPVRPSEKRRDIMELIASQPRITLTGISHRTGISTSTIHDRLKRIRKTYRLTARWEPRRATRTLPVPAPHREASTDEEKTLPKRSPNPG